MSSISHSISDASYHGVVSAFEPKESVRMRKMLETRCENQGINCRTACILTPAICTKTALVSSLIILRIPAAGAYFACAFANYFDHLKKIFQRPANFVLGSFQTKQELTHRICNEAASANHPFFFRTFVENNITAQWIL